MRRPQHCPACQVATELEEHRDAAADGWSVRRATLNFTLVIARRACPAYVPAQPDAGGDQ